MKTRPIAEPVGHQAPADPVLLADDLVVEVLADAEDRADRGIAVDGFEVVFVGIEVVVDQPGPAPSMAKTCRSGAD